MENRYKISYDIKQKKIVNISFMQGEVEIKVAERTIKVLGGD